MKKFVLAVLFASVPFVAQAKAKKEHGVDVKKQEAEFKSLDKDGDGGVSPEEAKSESKLNDGYKKADADNDGKVTLDEYKKFETHK